VVTGETARRRTLAAAAVLAFALGGFVLSWVSTHVDLKPVSAQAQARAGNIKKS
jgi:hypothetical protein